MESPGIRTGADAAFLFKLKGSGDGVPGSVVVVAAVVAVVGGADAGVVGIGLEILEWHVLSPFGTHLPE